MKKIWEALASRGSVMFMDLSEEYQARVEALQTASKNAMNAGMEPERLGSLSRMVMYRKMDESRMKLRGELLTDVEPLRLVLKPGAASE